MSVNTIACTICGQSGTVRHYEQRLDKDGRVCQISQCADCLVLLNETDLIALAQGETENIALQSQSSDHFYALDEQFKATFNQLIEENRLIDFMLEKAPLQSRQTFLDFGAGQGIVAAAAAKHFQSVFAVELSLNVLLETYQLMPHRERIFVSDDIDVLDIKFNAMASMHVLEHIPELGPLIRMLREKLEPDGVLLFQVPLLRGDYIVPTHYSFFNEVSVRKMAERFDFIVEGVWFDVNLDFLTAIFRRPPG